MSMPPVESSKLLYIVKFSESHHHLIDIEICIDTASLSPRSAHRDEPLELVFPVWTPGSYLIREYSRNIEAMRATAHESLDDEPSQELELIRIGKNRWQIAAVPSTRFVRICYRLYCRELSVRTNWVESDFGFLTGAATFPFLAGERASSLRVHLQLPKTWKNIATSLQPVEQNANVVHLFAADYDELVDSPIVCGNLEIREFKVGGRPHFLANLGGDRLWDLDRAVADTRTIVAEHQRFWGAVPYERYWFLNLNTESRGGLEHDNSCVLMCSRWAMHRRETYLDWLALVSHEFFHTWNVRRLRPRKLMQYDYEQEQFIEELWIAEGITSYFDDLVLVRTGLCTPDEYLGRLTKTIQTVQTAPGRLVQDLRNASWDAWTKHYRPDENSGNSRISYYLKGALVAWLLDVELQKMSGGEHALDDVMRLMWQRHLASGFSLEDFEQVVEELGSLALRSWLQQWVRQAAELDFQPALEWFGLRFKAEDSAKKTSFAKVWIGSQSTASEGKLIVRNVLRGSPSDRAGLNVDDELIALDGYRLSPETWPGHLEMFEPAQELALLVSRRGKLISLKITLGKKPVHNWELIADPQATGEARARLNTWLRQ